MSRKTKEITINSGRDAGKTFLIREKSALEAERFFTKMLLAIGRNTNIGSLIVSHGSLGVLKNQQIMAEALLSIDFETAQELMNEIFTCIEFKYVINGQSNSRNLEKEDIQDVETLMRLRKEVIDLHINFTEAERQSTSA